MRAYAGPIVIVDIDDTLRDSKYWRRRRRTALADAPPIPGALGLLRAAERHGARIVYLTAAGADVRAHNRRFLRRFPRGWLVDRPPSAGPDHYGAWKRGPLRALVAAHPRAFFVCLGDDRHADAANYGAVVAGPRPRGGRGRGRVFIRRTSDAPPDATTGFRRYAEIRPVVEALLRARRSAPRPGMADLRGYAGPVVVVGGGRGVTPRRRRATPRRGTAG